MNLFILRWNPNISSYKKKNHKDLVSHVNQGQIPMEFNWSIVEWQNLQKDDLFILQQVGTDNDGIAMIGKFQNVCYEGDSWRNDGTKVHYANLWIMEAFDVDKHNFLDAKRYQKLFPEIEWHKGKSGVVVERKTAKKLLETIEQDLISLTIWDENTLDKFIDYDFDAEINHSTSNGDLKDGTLLVKLKNAFIDAPTKENFANLIYCLHDSIVTLPVAKNKDSQSGFFPVQFLDKDNNGALGFFSNPNQVGKTFENDKNISFIDTEVLDFLKFYVAQKEIKSLILDPFNKPFTISKDMADLILNLDSED